jgi:ketosteroid isomerase-like protein
VPRSVTALICAALLAAVAGCGESDQEKAREVVQDYVEASNGDDFERVCELYSEEFKEQLGIDENCAGFVEEQSSGVEQELQLVEVRVNGDRGSAEIDALREEEGGPARIHLLLERSDGEWKISGFQ